MKASGAKAYLVNTGWNGTGKRISIKDTRGIIDAILSLSLIHISSAGCARYSTASGVQQHAIRVEPWNAVGSFKGASSRRANAG